MKIPSLLIIAITLTALAARAQAPPPQAVMTAQPEFEVASVRLGDPSHPNVADGSSPVSSFPSNRFYAHNLWLQDLIGIAYGKDLRHIIGAPGWFDSQPYEIDARVAGDRQLGLLEMRPLIQKLLEQRLHLTVHMETKMDPGFALVVLKGGPKLQTAKDDSSSTEKRDRQILPNRIDAPAVDLATFARFISVPAGHAVVDQTGLSGLYDISLKYAPQDNPDSSLPSLFTAIQDLGLKLVPQKVPVEYLVIDHVDRAPTEN